MKIGVNFPVRFISDQNYIISHRYSIFVKQYVQNFESYNFYRIMKEISGSSSVLSPRQPGILNGNIKCITSDEKVIGFLMFLLFLQREYFLITKTYFQKKKSHHTSQTVHWLIINFVLVFGDPHVWVPH